MVRHFPPKIQVMKSYMGAIKATWVGSVRPLGSVIGCYEWWMNKPAASLHEAGLHTRVAIFYPASRSHTHTNPRCSYPGEPSDPQSIHSQACRSQAMASPRTITLVALSFALGLFFVFMGTIKLTPRLSKDAYSEMASIRLLAMVVVRGHCSAGYRRRILSGLNNDDLNERRYGKGRLKKEKKISTNLPARNLRFIYQSGSNRRHNIADMLIVCVLKWCVS